VLISARQNHEIARRQPNWLATRADFEAGFAVQQYVEISEITPAHLKAPRPRDLLPTDEGATKSDELKHLPHEFVFDRRRKSLAVDVAMWSGFLHQ